MPTVFQVEPGLAGMTSQTSTPTTLSSRPVARPGLLAVALAQRQVLGDDRRGEPGEEQVERERADGGEREGHMPR